jgi:hypothetical protein
MFLVASLLLLSQGENCIVIASLHYKNISRTRYTFTKKE